jgi:lon-related putative ATP-dependent protease
MQKSIELLPSELRSCCNSSTFTFKSTSEVKPLEDVIGQERAVQAIHFGLNMDYPEYHIFVSGIDGSGKTTIVQSLVSNHAIHMKKPNDWCLVNNFQDEFRPIAIAIPSGKATILSRQIERLVRNLLKKMPEALKDISFEEKKDALQSSFDELEKKLLKPIEEKAAANELHIQKTATSIQPIPMLNNEPMTHQAFDALPQDKRQSIEDSMASVIEELEVAADEIQTAQQAMFQEIEEIFSKISRAIVEKRLVSLRKEYADCSSVLNLFNALESDIIENVDLFLPVDNNASDAQLAMMPQVDPELRYHINVLVDHTGTSGAPVIFEPNPTFRNLFGWIEKRAQNGHVTTDFSMVQAGSLLQANGGFLIMEIESLLSNSVVWEAFKRALLNKQLFIEDASAYEGQVTASLRPGPIGLDVKVILIGSYEPFEVLQNHDPKFNEIFKVRADFDYEVTDSDKTVQQYARFIARVCKEENLNHFSPDGAAAIIEFCKKLSGNQKKLSLRFAPIINLIKEAEYWSKNQGDALVTDRHVNRALEEHRFRYNLYEEKVHQSYLNETVLIDVDGKVVGQVNALAVYQMGEISFGRPSRITAETFMGKSGLINIERESQLSGSTHDKGVMILSGYLGRTFAQTYPLCLSASITFEQNYNGVDGDSASSTELYAILSSLAGIPINQGIAVTGSVNQKGQIQTIGGVNEKVEGFFEVCKSKGLSGQQGVIIPKANVQNLMLKQEVVDAVADGFYHIYPVESVDQGIEILTGISAGQVGTNGDYPNGSIYQKVQKRLETYFTQTLKWRKTADPF